MINKTLLAKIRDIIIADPDKFDMSNFEVTDECGTYRCIAGYANYFEGNKMSGTYPINEHVQKARNSLGLNEDQASILFFDWRWPQPYTPGEYDSKQTRDEKAIQFLDDIIENGWTEEMNEYYEDET